MNISRLSNTIIYLVMIVAGAGCAARQECPDINHTIEILNWSGSVPHKVTVARYAAESGYGMRLGDGFDYVAEISENPDGSRSMVLTPRNSRQVIINPSENFKIFIDGMIEYRISDIVTGPQRLGCAVRSAKVNKCSVEASKILAFDASCRQ